MSDELATTLTQRLGPDAPVDVWSARPGAAPVPRVAPRSAEAATEVLRMARAEGHRVLPLGGGSKLGWRALPSRVDLVLSTSQLVGIESYEPGDGTLTALAGTRMAELEARTVAGGHHLTPEVPFPERATLGGVAAAAASGRDRLRYGPTRHHVLGIRALLADGKSVQSGGRLVKNVTGYDLHRLLVGSQGTLALILEVSLRLIPAPQQRCVAHAEFDSLEEALHAARAIDSAGLVPETVCVERLGAGEAALWIVAAGRDDVLQDDLARLGEAVPTLRSVESELELHVLRALRDGEAPEGAHLLATCLPTDVARVAQALSAAARDEFEPRLRVHPIVATVLLAGSAPPEAFVRVLARANASLSDILADRRLSLSLRNASAPEAGEALDGSDLPAGGLALLGRLRTALDPTGVFARNSLAGSQENV